MENGVSELESWCEETAISSALEIAKKFHQQLQVSSSESEEISGPKFGFLNDPSKLNHLIHKFVDVFAHHLESQIFNPGDVASSGNMGLNLTNGKGPYNCIGSAEQGPSHEDAAKSTSENHGRIPQPDDSPDDDSPKAVTGQCHARKPFYRRLSLKGLRKGRLFHKQSTEEPAERRSNDKSSKTRVAKILVECLKEGNVHYLSGDNIDGSQKWEKCRLVLVKTVGGYMLEFYSPPKSIKPKSGVFCFLITEARETRTLEMPDRENTFVLKAENNMEYVIEASDAEDMKSWLATIKFSMRASLEETDVAPVGGNFAQTSRSHQNHSTIDSPTSEVQRSEHSSGEIVSPPQLPPRLVQSRNTGDNQLQTDESAATAGAPSTAPNNNHDASQSPRDVYSLLQEYPWFHGTLGRSEAARLVLQDEAEGHGVFLVRQSETRHGEFVLTFNFQGKAKHLRLNLSPEGQCRVQHLWFQSVCEMLEHFKAQPIPLESGGTSDVFLSEFVISLPSLRGLSQISGIAERTRTAGVPEVPLVVTHGGSVRTRSESLERLHREASTGTSRAVENAYSFVY